MSIRRSGIGIVVRFIDRLFQPTFLVVLSPTVFDVQKQNSTVDATNIARQGRFALFGYLIEIVRYETFQRFQGVNKLIEFEEMVCAR